MVSSVRVCGCCGGWHHIVGSSIGGGMSGSGGGHWLWVVEISPKIEFLEVTALHVLSSCCWDSSTGVEVDKIRVAAHFCLIFKNYL